MSNLLEVSYYHIHIILHRRVKLSICIFNLASLHRRETQSHHRYFIRRQVFWNNRIYLSTFIRYKLELGGNIQCEDC